MLRKGRTGPAPVAAIAAIAAVVAVALAGCGLPGDPAAPQVPACMQHARFGPAEESPYVLPYPPGAAHEVFQTYCGPVSHGKDGQMAIDFLMEVGSDVVAARAGTVRRAIEQHPDHGGRDFNAVWVEHDDGTVAFYGHLAQDGVRVEVGDRVAAGQPIAWSGSSGTSLPHLHFGVASSWPVLRSDNVPVNFRNAEGELDDRGGLRRGALYRALEDAPSADGVRNPS